MTRYVTEHKIQMVWATSLARSSGCSKTDCDEDTPLNDLQCIIDLVHEMLELEEIVLIRD